MSENASLNSKRPLSELNIDADDPDDLQLSKRLADSNNMPKRENNQPPINTIFTPSCDQGKMNLQNSTNSSNNQYTIPTHNSYDTLNNDKIVNNDKYVTKTQSQQKSVKIPPITVVGATNFTKAINILNDSTDKIDFTIKYMSIGTKIMLQSSVTYNKVKTLLNAANVEFFSHDLNSEKYDKFILSGIPKTPKEEIETALNAYQIEPVEIREIEQKNKRFNEETSYIVSFNHNTTNLKNLSKTRINYIVPKWRIFRNSKNNITQCRRCQLYGHGIRNCNMPPKCAKCGLNHLSDDCDSPVQKCANCKGDHTAISLECPKRKEFIEMRNRLASSNNKSSRKPTPAPRKNLNNFPNLKPTNMVQYNTTPRWAAQRPTNTNVWSNLFKDNSNKPSHSTTNNNPAQSIFKAEEIGPIMVELLTGLRGCQNKEQQLVVMFEIATKYIYNVDP